MSLRALRDRIGRIGSCLVSVVLRRPGDRIASKLSFLGLQPGCVQQSGMLILTDIEPGNKDALGHTLDNIRTRLIESQKSGQNISFYNTKTVHYAAWMILPGVRCEGKPDSPAKLVFETNYDGDLADHLKDLVANCRKELDEVYNFFPRYPPRGSNEEVAKFLCEKYQQTSSSIDATAFHVALQGRSLKDIRNAIAVYDEAKRFMDNPANKSNDPKRVRRALIDHFRCVPNGAPEKPERFPVTQKGLRGLFVINMMVLALLFPIALLYLLRWLVIDVIARYFECKEEDENLFDPTDRKTPEYAHLDLGRQNHLCTYTTVKPSCFRMYVMRRALWLGDVLFRYFFILGKLDQITTIHFGRWTLIGNQLLFYGNYDGSWSSYLSDFSEEAWGVNLVWGNTIGFPQTKFIIGGGARDLDGFEAQAAKHYAPAPVFYSAYRTRTLVNLLRYLEFRDELLEEIRCIAKKKR